VIRAAILYHVYSGHLFFTAAALFVVGALIPRVRLLVLLAIPLVALSGTPIHWPITLLVIAALTAYFIAPKRRIAVAAALTAVAIMVILELPYHLKRPDIPHGRLFVIGDSLASGGFGESRAWPVRLGAVNLSRAAETAATAREHLTSLPPAQPGDCVLVELGGNDMLNDTQTGDYASALDQLLRGIQPRRIVMLELPVVPGAWAYGAIQRRLARKHNAVLLPKRVLASVLSDPRNTSDGLHLTERGHAQLARDLAVYLDQ
jgi:lysophospholipase L1-like esterase